MAPSKKDCSVILFDLASQNRKRALQTLLKISFMSCLPESKDLTKLVLLNSDTTENRLNAHYGGYEHIYEVAKDVTVYEPDTQLQMIEGSGTGKASWLKGLSVAVKILAEEYESISGIITLQLLFITDLTAPLSQYDQADVLEIIKDIDKMGAFLYIVGPDIDAPFTIKNAEDIHSWMSKLEVGDNQNLKIAKKIVNSTKHSVMCNYAMGVHLFFSFRNWAGGQPWQVPFSIGNELSIPAETLKILNEGMPFKAQSETSSCSGITWIDAEDESIEVDPSSVRSGISHHGKFVIIENNKMFQVENPRTFSILCFTSSTNVPEYLMSDEGSYCVLPNGSPEQNRSMYTLIDRLATQNKYALARRVYNANAIPKIVALVPKPDHDPKCFYLVSLPFAEDFRYPYSEKKVEAAPKTEVVDEVYNFLDSLSVGEAKCQKRVPLSVQMMVEQNCLKLVNKCADKILEKHMRLEEVEIDYTTGAPSGDVVDDLKKIWVERKIEDVAKNEDINDGDDSDNDFEWE